MAEEQGIEAAWEALRKSSGAHLRGPDVSEWPFCKACAHAARALAMAVLEEAREGGWQSDCREDREACDTGADACHYHELRARIEALGKEAE